MRRRNWLIRYADDFVILVRGSREQAQAVRDEAAQVLRDELEMELSEEKTVVTHVTDSTSSGIGFEEAPGAKAR